MKKKSFISLFISSFICLACQADNQRYPLTDIQKIAQSDKKYLGKQVSVYGYLSSENFTDFYALHATAEGFLIKAHTGLLFMEVDADLRACHGFLGSASGTIESIEGLSSKNIQATRFSIYENVPHIHTGELPTQKQVDLCQTYIDT